MKNLFTKYYQKLFLSEDESKDTLDYGDRHINEELFAQWDNSLQSNNHEYYDPDKGWLNISSKINNKRYRNSRVYKRILAYGFAAEVIIAFLLVFGHYSKSTDNTKFKELYVFSTGKQDEKEIILSDGTTVKLGAQSKLTYPSDFKGDIRQIKLEGQAFFDVTSNPENPFIVELNNVKVRVLGTSFEIFEDKERGVLETSLLTGKVEVIYTDKSQSDKIYPLTPSEKITISLNDGVKLIEYIKSEDYCARRDFHGLCFTNERLTNIIPRLEKWYGCKIHLNDINAENLRFTFKVKHESIETILQLLTTSSPLKYEVENLTESIYNLKL